MIETTVGGEKVRLQQGVVIFNADGTPASFGGTAPAGGQASESSLSKLVPATLGAAVTPNDSTPLTSRAVWVGGAGNLSVRFSGDPATTVVLSGVPAGTLLPISVVRVMAATTCTNVAVLN